MSFIQSQTPSLGGKLLGPDSEQEHSWDMFKIGQTALHLKLVLYIALLTIWQREVKIKWVNDRGKLGEKSSFPTR